MNLSHILHMSSYDAGIALWYAWLQGARETPAWVIALLLALMAASKPLVLLMRRHEHRRRGND
ncbi:hypothetical protein [Metallibacterium scheffleri]